MKSCRVYEHQSFGGQPSAFGLQPFRRLMQGKAGSAFPPDPRRLTPDPFCLFSAFSLQPSAFKSQPSLFNSRSWIWCILITSAALLLGCGYQFSGGGELRGGIQRVFISQLDNRTAEVGLENAFTSDLRYEFIRYNRIADQDEAEAVLSGTIKSLRVQTVSRKTEHTSQERQVIVTVNLKLKDKNGRVLWSVEGLADSESYTVEESSQATEANKRAALSAIAKRLAENVYYRLTENF